jgi:stage III sporulation protein AF
MEALRSWATTACLAALVAGLAGIIAPSGKLEKVYKFAVSLFFLCCLLVPLFTLKSINLNNLTIPQTQVNSAAAALQTTVNNQAEQMAESNIIQLVKNCCSDCSAAPLDVTVNVNSVGGKLSVESAEVILKSADMNKQKAIQDEVMSKLGINVIIKDGGK